MQIVNVRGNWEIRQRRGGEGPENDVTVRISISRTATNPDTGTGEFYGQGEWDGRVGELGGDLDRERVHFTITWPDGREGDYRGFRYPDGYLRGHTFNVNNPAEAAEWWSAQPTFVMIDA